MGVENSSKAMFNARVIMLVGSVIIVTTLFASFTDFSFFTIFGVFVGLVVLLVGFSLSVRAWCKVAGNIDSILQQLLDRQALRQSSQAVPGQELPAYGVQAIDGSPEASRVATGEPGAD